MEKKLKTDHTTLDCSTAGLRKGLFAALEDLRDGLITPREALATAKLVEQTIATVELDMRMQRFRQQFGELPPPANLDLYHGDE